MRALITGGAGFLGSNLAARLMAEGATVGILDNLSRVGSEINLDWLSTQRSFDFYKVDIRDSLGVDDVVARFRPDTVFHFAGQVAMTTSLLNPRLDFEINALGSLNILEAVRKHANRTSLIYSSTNKVYGDLERFSYSETDTRYVLPQYPRGLPSSIPLDFHSPYGCSKGCADQYVLDYGRIFDFPVAVFRHSSMYGGRQFATEDQGWIGWFCSRALRARRGVDAVFTVSGSGKQVRDVLHADDMVDLYFRAAMSIQSIAGRAFNVGGGPYNSLSILELLQLLQEKCAVSLGWTHIDARISDQKVFVADLSEIHSCLGWQPRIGIEEGLELMLDWARSSGQGQ